MVGPVRARQHGGPADVLPHAASEENRRDEPGILLSRTPGGAALADRAPPFSLPGTRTRRDGNRLVGKRRADRAAVPDRRRRGIWRRRWRMEGGRALRRTLHHVRDRRTHPRIALRGRRDLPASQGPVVGLGAPRGPGALPLGARRAQGRPGR